MPVKVGRGVVTRENTEPIYVLWWIPEGHVPTVEEAKQKLDHLRTHGPTLEAFDFRHPHPGPTQ